MPFHFALGPFDALLSKGPMLHTATISIREGSNKIRWKRKHRKVCSNAACKTTSKVKAASRPDVDGDGCMHLSVQRGVRTLFARSAGSPVHGPPVANTHGGHQRPQLLPPGHASTHRNTNRARLTCPIALPRYTHRTSLTCGTTGARRFLGWGDDCVKKKKEAKYRMHRPATPFLVPIAQQRKHGGYAERQLPRQTIQPWPG